MQVILRMWLSRFLFRENILDVRAFLILLLFHIELVSIILMQICVPECFPFEIFVSFALEELRNFY